MHEVLGRTTVRTRDEVARLLEEGLSQNAIADYWRWMTVHMWVEVTFEVFTTCVVAYLLTQMGLITSRRWRSAL